MLYFKTFLPFLAGLGDVRGYQDGAVAEIAKFNATLFDIAMYAGAIVIAIAVVQIIMSLQEQSATAKAKGAMLLGLGIILVTASSVLKAMHLVDASDIQGLAADPAGGAISLVENTIDVFGSGLRWVGIILIALAIVQLLISFYNEDVREKVDGTKVLATGILLLSVSSILTNIVTVAVRAKAYDENNGDGAAATQIVKYILWGISSFGATVGIGLVALGTYHFVVAIKDGDGSSKAKAIMPLVIGVLLISTRIILNFVLDVDMGTPGGGGHAGSVHAPGGSASPDLILP